jgi:hypothetical protein
VKRPLSTKARSCTGKRRHDTEQAALDHLHALRRQGAVRLNAYRRRHCNGGWHVGHLPKPRT